MYKVPYLCLLLLKAQRLKHNDTVVVFTSSKMFVVNDDHLSILGFHLHLSAVKRFGADQL